MTNALFNSMETLSPKQREIMGQIFLDGGFSINELVGLPYNSDARKMLQTAIENFLNNTYSKFGIKEPVANGEYVYMEAKLGFNGGNICLREYSEKSKMDKYENGQIGMDFREYRESHILVEPSNYPFIEPYNRQTPYYVPCVYSQMEPLKTEQFGIFDRTTYKTNGCGFVCCLNADYNGFWHYSEINIFVKKDQLVEFMNEYLKGFIFEEAAKNHLIGITEKFLNLQKSE